MRFAVACMLALLVAPPLVSSSEAEPRDALAVSTYSGPDVGAIITWTPAPNGVAYAIYRGSTPDERIYIGQTPALIWHDEAPLPGDSWYTIVSIAPQGNGPLQPLQALGGFRGSCVNHNGTTGVTVTASHCMPADPL